MPFKVIYCACTQALYTTALPLAGVLQAPSLKKECETFHVKPLTLTAQPNNSEQRVIIVAAQQRPRPPPTHLHCVNVRPPHRSARGVTRSICYRTLFGMRLPKCHGSAAWNVNLEIHSALFRSSLSGAT